MDPDDDKYKKEPYYMSETVSSKRIKIIFILKKRENVQRY